MSPAVNLALEEVPFAILEAVKARIMANRRRLGAGRDDERPPPSLKPRPQLRKFGANGKTYRRPEPAATGAPRKNYQALWIAVDDYAYFDSSSYPGVGSTKKFTIFSLNGQFRLEAEFPYPSAQYYDVAVAKHILPIDGSNLILILCMQSRPEAISNPVDIQCFRVSKNNVRKITTPVNSGINALQNGWYTVGVPPYIIPAIGSRYHGIGFVATMQYLSYPITYYSRAKFGDIYPAAYSFQQEHTPFDEFSATTYSEFSCYGPGIYTFLLDPDAAYTAIDRVGSTYANFSNAYALIGASNMPTNSYAVSLLDNAFDKLLRFNDQVSSATYDTIFAPVDGVENVAWIKAKTNIKSLKPSNPYSGARSLIFPSFFWNWDKPDYCKEKLIQCGFTSSDLDP